MDERKDLKFYRKVKNQKIFGAYIGVLQNLDQGSGWALKTVFLKYGTNEKKLLKSSSVLQMVSNKLVIVCNCAFLCGSKAKQF